MPDTAKTDEKTSKAVETKPTQMAEKTDNDDLEWLQYQDVRETRKLSELMRSNPLVPIGAAATVIALCCGIVNMLKHNSKKQQFYMRARVGAQGFTVASLIGGMFYQARMKT